MKKTFPAFAVGIAILCFWILVVIWAVNVSEAEGRSTPQVRSQYVGMRVSLVKEKIPVGPRLSVYRSTPTHRDHIRKMRRTRTEVRTARKAARGGAGGIFLAIRICESGNNYKKNTGNDFYGAYQFTIQTYFAYGGRVRPDLDTPGNQDRIAKRLYDAVGVGTTASWPNCPRR